jgi:tyrosyl-tRNA synthetase
MYGKLMSIPDSLIGDYFELLTDMPDEELDAIRESIDKRTTNPMEHKKRLAREIVAYFHSREEAQAAEDAFVATFSKGELPEDVPEVPAPNGEFKLSSFLAQHGLAASASEANRLIDQGAVEINGVKATRKTDGLKTGDTIRVGKHRFVRIGRP